MSRGHCCRQEVGKVGYRDIYKRYREEFGR